MFGKSNGPQAAPQQTSNMWADMLGIGPMLATIQDPAFQEQIRSLLRAVLETHARCERIENLLMSMSVADAAGNIALIPIRDGAAGTRTSTAAPGASDDGGGGATADCQPALPGVEHPRPGQRIA